MPEERRKGFIFGALFGIVITFGLISVARYFGIHLYLSGSAAQQAYDKTKVIEECIDEYYQGEIQDGELADGAAKGMVSALNDKYSQYYTEAEYEELMSEINGSYVGIGVTLRQEEDNSIVVVEVSENGPADQAGIRKGDVFIRVDGRDVAGMKLDEMISMIKTEANDGKTVTVTVERQKQSLDLDVVCAKVDVVSVKSQKIGTVGYIKIKEFDKETDEQFGAALENLKRDNVTGLVLDVRNNGGGSLDSVIHMLDELLPKGELITEKSKKDGDRVYHSTDDASFTGPIAVLMNGRSASASEVFAGTLQARKAATLVGTKSFGKGVVQTVLSLENSCGGGLKLTTAEYFLPGGVSIHKKGLTPDVEVQEEELPELKDGEPPNLENNGADTENDHQLIRALEIVNGQ